MSPIPNFSLPVGLSVHSLQDNICAPLLEFRGTWWFAFANRNCRCNSVLDSSPGLWVLVLTQKDSKGKRKGNLIQVERSCKAEIKNPSWGCPRPASIQITYQLVTDTLANADTMSQSQSRSVAPSKWPKRLLSNKKRVLC